MIQPMDVANSIVRVADHASRDIGAVGFRDVKVLVVGDIILDVYLQGAVTRVSPEAPVPVVHQNSLRDVPGGAANVAANISSLGGHCRLIGVIGQDDAGSRLQSLLKKQPNIDVSFMVKTPDRPTITKTRVMCGRYQLVRIDNEDNSKIAGSLTKMMIDSIDAAIEWADVLLISDYEKGVCTREVMSHALAKAKSLGRPSIVDPKQRDMSIYAGASVIKPNRLELANATGMPVGNDAECEAAARKVISMTGSSIMLTRSENGMSYFSPDQDPVHLPTFAKEVFDVSGAGDTVAAALALGFGSGLPLVHTMRCANHAAGIVVSKAGTATVTLAELAAALHVEDHDGLRKRGQLVSLSEAVKIREIWRQMELTVGFTNGCFDLVHPGHVTLLEKSAAQCDRLIVALNTDASVSKLKGPTRPVQDEESRARVVGALESVDLVILFGEQTPIEAITALNPDLLIKGADYTEDKVVGADFVKAHGGRVALIDLVEGQSTTRLIGRSNASPEPAGTSGLTNS